MTGPEEELGPTVHPAATLLPWYLNGTLWEAERQRVAQHLTECQTCRSELEELTQLRRQVKEAYADLPGPSPQAFRSVMATLQQGRRSQPELQRGFRWERAETTSWFDALDRCLRPLLARRWAPTLAAILIVGQLAVLLWVMGWEPARSPQDGLAPSNGVVSRGIPMATARYRVAFYETAPEQQIRAVMRDIAGRIVDGPSTEGFYTVEVPAGDAAAVAAKLDALRSRSDVIRSAERLEP